MLQLFVVVEAEAEMMQVLPAALAVMAAVVLVATQWRLALQILAVVEAAVEELQRLMEQQVAQA